MLFLKATFCPWQQCSQEETNDVDKQNTTLNSHTLQTHYKMNKNGEPRQA